MSATKTGRHGLLIAAASLLLLGGKSTLAADAAATASTDNKTQVQELETVVVTGTHIRSKKDVYNSASPIQIIGHEESVLAGFSNTADTLQDTAVSGSGYQINSYYGGFVTDGGPGANTLGLRGLGAVRTLILLNGRRLAPAGTRGSVGSADLNVLPDAIVDRIEVLKDGASSVYGSDAVAGVVNIITKNGINNFTVEADRISTFDGGGNTTKFSIVGGKSSDRGQILGSLEFYNRSELTLGQRDWASCPTQVLVDPSDGSDAGSILDPVTGKPKCFPIGLTGTNGVAHDYVVSPSYVYNSATDDYDFVGNRWVLDPTSTGPVPGWRNVDPLSQRPNYDPRQLNDSLISPTRNYTGFVTGSYDTGVLGHGEAYFEGLWTARESKQIGTRQLSLDYQLGPGFSNHPFVPQVLYDLGGGVALNPFGDIVISRGFTVWGNDTSSQKLNFGRFVGGMRGDLPFGDWRYDINGTMNRAKASYTFQSFLEDRIYNSLYLSQVAPSYNGPKRVGTDGNTYTCTVNITAPGTGCVPAPLLTDLVSSNIDQPYRDYVWQDVTGNTLYRESTISAVFNGSLFDLPYGSVGAAIGAEYRTMSLDDEPDPEMQAGNLYNFTTSGVTKGSDKVKEEFAELQIPLLAGLPGAQDLSLNLSGRHTDYQSYGSDNTYKVGLNWSPMGWIKLRGTRGSSYRAPAIFEQYLSPTTGFLSGDTDPCYLYGSQYPTTSQVYINCAAEGLPGNWLASNSVQVNSAGGAALGLDSEKSRAETGGIVLQPTLPTSVGDLQVAADWWRIRVRNQVAQIGASNLLNLCYNDPQFRAGGSYCTYSSRDPNGNLIVDDNYINIATQMAEGIDYNLRYTRDIGTGVFTVNAEATQYRKQQSRLLPTDPIDNYNGAIYGAKWVGDIQLKYKWKSWTYNYYLSYVDKMDSNDYLGVDTSTDPFNFAVGSYITHAASVKYQGANDWSVVVGIRNLFDAKPKTITPGYYDRVGNALLYSGYDYFGRRAFVSVSKGL